VINSLFIVDNLGTIVVTMWYQFIDNSWLNIQIIFLALQVFATIYMVLVIAESPKWLYTWKNYAEAREILSGVARFNAVEEKK
jgi:hypothetical protein